MQFSSKVFIFHDSGVQLVLHLLRLLGLIFSPSCWLSSRFRNLLRFLKFWFGFIKNHLLLLLGSQNINIAFFFFSLNIRDTRLRCVNRTLLKLLIHHLIEVSLSVLYLVFIQFHAKELIGKWSELRLSRWQAKNMN